MKIKAKSGVSFSEVWSEFDLDDLGIRSIELWNELTESEQKEVIQSAIDDLTDQPYLLLEEFKEID